MSSDRLLINDKPEEVYPPPGEDQYTAFLKEQGYGTGDGRAEHDLEDSYQYDYANDSYQLTGDGPDDVRSSSSSANERTSLLGDTSGRSDDPYSDSLLSGAYDDEEEDDDDEDAVLRRYSPANMKRAMLACPGQTYEWFRTLPERVTRETLMLAFCVIMVVVVGTANRVTFKIMQLSAANYSYFESQLTTFIYLPVNFGIIAIKLLFTDHITKDDHAFPKWKFLVMGALDSAAGVLIVVGGVQVPGIMQNLLLQLAVPVTMLFSILLLKPATDTWKKHLKTFYTPFQYIGAVIVLLGLVISVLPSLTGSSGSAGPPLWDMVFSLATIPTALSGVYKEIAFRKAGDMDVFWLNGWVSLFQFLIGLLYAPLAALAQGLPIKDIPSNLWDGLRCFLLGSNFISPACDPTNHTLTPSCNVTVEPYPFCNSTDGSGSAADFLGDSMLMPMQYDTAGSLMLDPLDPMNPMMSAELASSSASAALDLFGFTAYSMLPTEEVFLAALADSCTTKNAHTQLYDCSVGCEPECLIDVNCGAKIDGVITVCCDSCNGRYPQVSPVSALLANLMYMTCNIAYNIFLLLVIKYGSAALMYVASTIVLPLGSLAFTVTAFMGLHAGTFDVYNGTGLGLVLFGLIIYRFVGGKKKQKGDNQAGAEILDGTPGTMTLIGQTMAQEVPIRPRDIQTSRGTYYSRLGLRHVPPRAMPSSSAESGSLTILQDEDPLDDDAELTQIAESL